MSKRQLETKFARKIERNPAVFGGVRSREKTAVFAVLHIFAVRLQNARGRTGFRKNFTQHCKVKTHRVAQTKTFGEAGGVDVHHHVDQRFYFRRFTRFADVANGLAKFFQNGLRCAKRFLISAAH